MLNRIIVMGRLTRDPELRRTKEGVSVTSFSVACERDYKAQDGSRTADFIDVVAWRQTADFVTQYASKGRMVVVEGRLQIRDYTGRDGTKKRATEIIADHVYFADRKPDNSQGGQYTPPGGGYGAGAGYGGYTGGGYGNSGSGGYGGQPPQYGAVPRDGVSVSAPPVDQSTGEYTGEDGDLPF